MEAFFYLLLFTSSAQTVNTDSLWRIAETSADENARMDVLQSLHFHYTNIEIDSNFYYSKRLFKICNKINTPRYIALGFIQSSYVYYRIGDYKTVQEHIVKSAAIAEKIQDLDIQSRIENFRYLIESNQVKKIEYIRKAVKYRETVNISDKVTEVLLGNLSGVLLQNSQIDSAYYFAQKMYQLAI